MMLGRAEPMRSRLRKFRFYSQYILAGEQHIIIMYVQGGAKCLVFLNF